jgi:hypothetical protein
MGVDERENDSRQTWGTSAEKGAMASLRRVLPDKVQREIGADSGDWVAELDRFLRAAQQILDRDVTSYSERRDQVAVARKYRAGGDVREGQPQPHPARTAHPWGSPASQARLGQISTAI